MRDIREVILVLNDEVRIVVPSTHIISVDIQGPPLPAVVEYIAAGAVPEWDPIITLVLRATGGPFGPTYGAPEPRPFRGVMQKAIRDRITKEDSDE